MVSKVVKYVLKAVGLVGVAFSALLLSSISAVQPDSTVIQSLLYLMVGMMLVGSILVLLS
ncbi:MAG: hypothetical protein NZ920_01015 [Aigarchaeota archaeon]|nr:hypothetical protein [Aigarchaeota archaeon]MDW8093022.1 hypothetical protein [Nitrososphaerota archaeon]